MSALHAQVLISLGNRSADVDAGIAPLILALWRRDIGTVASCESWPLLSEHVGAETAFVAFSSEEEFERFERVVEDCSRVLLKAKPDAEVAARLRVDPDYLAECAEKGGPWGIGFPPTDLKLLARHVGAAA